MNEHPYPKLLLNFRAKDRYWTVAQGLEMPPLTVGTIIISSQHDFPTFGVTSIIIVTA